MKILEYLNKIKIFQSGIRYEACVSCSRTDLVAQAQAEASAQSIEFHSYLVQSFSILSIAYKLNFDTWCLTYTRFGADDSGLSL